MNRNPCKHVNLSAVAWRWVPTGHKEYLTKGIHPHTEECLRRCGAYLIHRKAILTGAKDCAYEIANIVAKRQESLR